MNKVVEFAADIEDMEAYSEKGMRARIVSIECEDLLSDDKHEHIYKITFDYSDFDDFNKDFESSNYYDNHGNPCLTARQANQYKQTETIYFGSPELFPFENYFSLIDGEREKLVNKFNAQTEETNYVRWLEAQILGD
jgi:hypothetical protein